MKSNFFLLMAAIIWGFAFVAQVETTGRIGSFTYNGVRYLLGAVSLIPVVLIFERERLSRRNLHEYLRYGLVCGTVLFLASNLQQEGIVMLNSAGKAGFITGLYTVLVPIFAFVLFGKRNAWTVWLGAALAVLGLALLCLPGDNGMMSGREWIGFFLVLASSVFWSVHILCIDRFAANLSPIKFSLTQFVFCGAWSMLVAVVAELDSAAMFGAQVADARYSILYGGLMSVGIAYTCQVIGQRGANPTAAAIIMSTESVWSAVGEMLFYLWLVPNPAYRPMSWLGWLGCAVLFAGILVSQIPSARRTEPNG